VTSREKLSLNKDESPIQKRMKSEKDNYTGQGFKEASEKYQVPENGNDDENEENNQNVQRIALDLGDDDDDYYPEQSEGKIENGNHN